MGEALAAAGYDVVAVEPPRLVEVFDTWFEFIAADLQTMSPMIEPILSADANLFLRTCWTGARWSISAEYTRIVMARQSLIREWSLWFAEHRRAGHPDVDPAAVRARLRHRLRAGVETPSR